MGKGNYVRFSKKRVMDTSRTEGRMELMEPYAHCGKKHTGACYWNTSTCFMCGKTCHIIKDCSKMKKGEIRKQVIKRLVDHERSRESQRGRLNL